MAPAHAIIVVGKTGRNITAPGGSLRGSGWDYEGEWHGFSGTVIGPHHFISAAHVHGYPGAAFVFRGTVYRAVDSATVPGTDLCVWRVAGTFPFWAPLYEGRREVGNDLILFGRGTARGPAIRLNGAVHGWRNGPPDTRLSWGRSWGLRTISTPNGGVTTAFQGDALTAPFDADAGPDAGCVSSGDSGGGVFIQDTDGQWKLAGVIYGVESGFFLHTDSSSGINGVLFDTRGLYRRVDNGAYLPIPADGAEAYPMQSIISRVSSNLIPIRRAMRSTTETEETLRTLALWIGIPTLLLSLWLVVLLRKRRLRKLNLGITATNIVL